MRYSQTDLAHLAGPIDTVSDRLKDLAALPSMAEVRSLATWDEGLLSKFDRLVTDLQGDRSGAMAELSYLMAEHGWSDEQMYVGLTDVDDRWGKFVGRYNRHSILTDLVNRARQKVGYDISMPDVEAMLARIEGGGDKPKQTRFTWTEFVKADFPVTWMVEGLLPAQGIGLIVAPPGTGKSRVALNMAAHLATGRKRFWPWWVRGGAQRVLWLSLEMNASGMHMFVSKMNGAYLEPADQRLLHQNFIMRPIGEPLALDQPAGQEWLNTQLAKEQPDVVVIDSLQKIASKEMTDEGAVKDLMHYLSTVRVKFNTSMVIVHHHRKKSTEAAKKHVLELDDVYGSRYITADVDFVLALQKTTEETLSVRTLKNRYARGDHDFNVMASDNLTFEFVGAGMQDIADGLAM